jgi:hypothetical protein
VAERQDSDREVLTSLPRSRPERRSAKRGDRAAQSPTRSARLPGAPAAQPRAPKPAPAASARAKPTAKAPPERAAAPRPAPPRKVPPAGYAAPTSRADDAGPSSAVDLLSTTIQATAELAQIGLTVGRQTLRSMLDRLPKP